MSARSERIRTVVPRRKIVSKTQVPAGKTVMTGLPLQAGPILPTQTVCAPAAMPAPVCSQPAWTLYEYLDFWLKTYKRGTVKPTTYDTLERVVLAYIKDSIGDIPLGQLTTEDIQGLINQLKEDMGYSHSTVKKVYDCLNASLRYAVQRRIISENPMEFVTMPARALFQANEITFFSEAECRCILEECSRKYATGTSVHWYGPLYTLLLLTGLRLGEVLGLHKDDYDAERSVLKVRRSVCKVRKRDEEGNLLPGFVLEETTTKSYSGTREIPLPPQAVAAIETLLLRAPYGSEYIVTNRNGNMPSPEQIGRSFHFLLRNVGIPPVGVHTLRHTYASLLFASKTDLKMISRLLGHASANITLSTYIHIADQIPYSAVSPLENLFEPISA